MRSRIESLWESAAGDGALTPVGVPCPESDCNALLDAWSRERQASIECRLALEESGRLMRAILNEDCVPTRLRRRMKRLMYVIRTSRGVE